MRVKRLSILFSILIPVMLLFSAPAGAGGPYAERHVMLINAPAVTNVSTDISFADKEQRYYVADRNNKGVDVFNAEDDFYLGTFGMGKFAGVQIPRQKGGPNGVLVDDRGQIWSGDGDSTVKVGTLNAGIKHTIDTGGTQRADELGFDPEDDIVLVANDAEPVPFLTFISSKSFTVLGRLFLTGGGGTPKATGLEQPVWDPETRLFYVTVPTAAGGEIDAINPKTEMVTRRIFLYVLDSIGCGGANKGVNGLALGPHGNLAAACPGAGEVVHIKSGALAALPIPKAGGADEVWFNPGDHTYLFGQTPGGVNTPGTDGLLAIVDAESNTLSQTLTISNPTGGRCCNVAANRRNNHIFSPIPGRGIDVIFKPEHHEGHD